MPKFLATYMVKVTVHAPDDADAAEREAPTNAAVEAAVEQAIAELVDGAPVNASSERTDI